MNKRIYTEKKGIFDVESPKILQEIKTIIPNIEAVKVYNIYDVFGLSVQVVWKDDRPWVMVR